MSVPEQMMTGDSVTHNWVVKRSRNSECYVQNYNIDV